MALFYPHYWKWINPCPRGTDCPGSDQHGEGKGRLFRGENCADAAYKKRRTADHKRVEKFFLDNQPKPEAKDIAKNDAANFCAG